MTLEQSTPKPSSRVSHLSLCSDLETRRTDPNAASHAGLRPQLLSVRACHCPDRPACRLELTAGLLHQAVFPRETCPSLLWKHPAEFPRDEGAGLGARARLTRAGGCPLGPPCPPGSETAAVLWEGYMHQVSHPRACHFGKKVHVGLNFLSNPSLRPSLAQ